MPAALQHCQLRGAAARQLAQQLQETGTAPSQASLPAGPQLKSEKLCALPRAMTDLLLPLPLVQLLEGRLRLARAIAACLHGVEQEPLQQASARACSLRS